MSATESGAGEREVLIDFLPAIRRFVPATAEAGDLDTCVVCGDGECGGDCPDALYVVRQVMEAFDNADDRQWWIDYFAEDGITIPATPDADDASDRCRYKMHGPGDTCDCDARLAAVTTHVRTSTPQGPDYCEPCSTAISEWVQWPCPGTSHVAEKIADGLNTPAASTDASGALSEAEWDAITEASWSGGSQAWKAEVERIIQARESVAATRARAEALDRVETEWFNGNIANHVRDRIAGDT